MRFTLGPRRLPSVVSVLALPLILAVCTQSAPPPDPEPTLRDRIERAAVGAIPASDRRRVRYVAADGLQRFLAGLSVADCDETENVTAGYAVRVEVPAADRMPNRRAVARLIGSALLRRRSSS